MPEIPTPTAPAPASPQFVDVYVTATGRKQTVPAHYMDDPILSAPFRKTPLTEKQQREADAALAQAATTDTPSAGD